MNHLTDTSHIAVGIVVPQTNERTGTTRYWVVESASGPVTMAMVNRAITTAAITGSVGATFSIGGDGVEDATVEVVELVRRQAFGV